MLVSELISKLQEIQKEHGDIPVLNPDYNWLYPEWIRVESSEALEDQNKWFRREYLIEFDKFVQLSK